MRFLDKFIPKPISFEVIEPIGRLEFTKKVISYLLIFGLVSYSFLTLSNELRRMGEIANLAHLTFALLIVSFFACRYVLKKIIPYILGRLKSIDPEINTKKYFVFSIMYLPLTAIPFLCILIGASANSLRGKLSKVVKWLGLFFIFSGFSFVFCLAMLGSNPQLESQFKNGNVSKFASTFTTPFVFFMVDLIGDSALSMTSFEKETRPLESRKKGFCGKSRITDISVFAKNFTKWKGELTKIPDYVQQISILKQIIENLDECKNASRYPSGFNSFWAFLPNTVFEGFMVLSIEVFFESAYFLKIGFLIERIFQNVSSSPDKDNQVDILKQKFRETQFYSNYRSVKNSSLARTLSFSKNSQ